MQCIEDEHSEREGSFPRMRFTIPHHNPQGLLYGDFFRYGSTQEGV